MLKQLRKEMSLPTPLSIPTHAGTQYKKYMESLLHDESLTILLMLSSCPGWLERVMSPGRESCTGCRGDGGTFQRGCRGSAWTSRLFLPPPPVQPPCQLSQADGSQQTRGCPHAVPKEPQHCFTSLSNLLSSAQLYHMNKCASSIQEQRGSSYCSSPIRHLQSFYTSTHQCC